MNHDAIINFPYYPSEEPCQDEKNRDAKIVHTCALSLSNSTAQGRAYSRMSWMTDKNNWHNSVSLENWSDWFDLSRIWNDAQIKGEEYSIHIFVN